MTDYLGWTPPPGVEVVPPPVHPETKVAVFWSDGSGPDDDGGYNLAKELNWSGFGDGPSIVAYAVVEEYKPAPDEGWSDWRTDVSEWNVTTHDVRFECVGGIHKISTRPRSEVLPAALREMSEKQDQLVALAVSMDAAFEAAPDMTKALEEIIHMGHDCPATFPGDETAWEAHRARMMQGIARAALARAKGATT